MTPSAYARLRAIARRSSRRAEEADDLVQEALLAAVKAGRTDLGDVATLRWIGGIIRNQATLAARTAARRVRRETSWHRAAPDDAEAQDTPPFAEIVDGLPRALKALAALALTGHSRREIAYLLRLPDTALRQRVAALKKHFRARGIAMPGRTPGLTLDLHYGRIRDVLLPQLIRQGGVFASHDPDGHLFIVRGAHKPAAGGN
jgi:DNA-directed RNA polymerase specialized sigma24 family protein